MSQKKNRKKALKLKMKRQGLLKGQPVQEAAPAKPAAPKKPAQTAAEVKPAPKADQVDVFAGLGATKQASLEEAGFKTLADFEKASEKEVLAVKGIGPAAITSLKENGVSFKA
ncbi:hypothetical cytosolic protein [Streptococcus criceti]|uniref:Helix-hairpin-helix domain-containing protein n=1 Tax=Streptococcus criceti HS-6 TaxID=873449 RepID=G5JSG8_STRCG|nr:hypothetical protein [Streptococcus criceti]EHI74992.1 hypothetical protein STRCR_2167 [Streptococcus criceti HS-6]SUN42763.1 hypothetical cytosolic protein [Streptococcus criceti]